MKRLSVFVFASIAIYVVWSFLYVKCNEESEYSKKTFILSRLSTDDENDLKNEMFLLNTRHPFSVENFESNCYMKEYKKEVSADEYQNERKLLLKEISDEFERMVGEKLENDFSLDKNEIEEYRKNINNRIVFSHMNHYFVFSRHRNKENGIFLNEMWEKIDNEWCLRNLNPLYKSGGLSCKDNKKLVLNCFINEGRLLEQCQSEHCISSRLFITEDYYLMTH